MQIQNHLISSPFVQNPHAEIKEPAPNFSFSQEISLKKWKWSPARICSDLFNHKEVKELNLIKAKLEKPASPETLLTLKETKIVLKTILLLSDPHSKQLKGYQSDFISFLEEYKLLDLSDLNKTLDIASNYLERLENRPSQTWKIYTWKALTSCLSQRLLLNKRENAPLEYSTQEISQLVFLITKGISSETEQSLDTFLTVLKNSQLADKFTQLANIYNSNEPFFIDGKLWCWGDLKENDTFLGMNISPFDVINFFDTFKSISQFFLENGGVSQICKEMEKQPWPFLSFKIMTNLARWIKIDQKFQPSSKEMADFCFSIRQIQNSSFFSQQRVYLYAQECETILSWETQIENLKRLKEHLETPGYLFTIEEAILLSELGENLSIIKKFYPSIPCAVIQLLNDLRPHLSKTSKKETEILRNFSKGEFENFSKKIKNIHALLIKGQKFSKEDLLTGKELFLIQKLDVFFFQKIFKVSLEEIKYGLNRSRFQTIVSLNTEENLKLLKQLETAKNDDFDLLLKLNHDVKNIKNDSSNKKQFLGYLELLLYKNEINTLKNPRYRYFISDPFLKKLTSLDYSKASFSEAYIQNTKSLVNQFTDQEFSVFLDKIKKIKSNSLTKEELLSLKEVLLLKQLLPFASLSDLNSLLSGIDMRQIVPYQMQPVTSIQENLTLFSVCNQGFKYYANLEPQLSQVLQLREKIAKEEDLSPKELILYLDICKCFHALNYARASHDSFPFIELDCPVFNELRQWTPDLFNLEKITPIRVWECEALQEKIKELDEEKFSILLNKLKNIDTLDFEKNENKFTFKEFSLLSEIDKIERKNDPVFKSFILAISKIKNRKKGQSFVRVCFHKNKGEKIENLDKDATTWEKIKYFIKKIFFVILNFFARHYEHYTHCNFLFYDKSQNLFFKRGLWQNDIYNESISGNYSPNIVEYDIDVEKLIPTELPLEKRENFKKDFYEELNSVTNQKYPNFSFPKSHVKKALSFPLQTKKITPIDIRQNLKDQKRELFCSQFVCESIIAAQVKACENAQIEPPSSLSFFGLYNKQHMERLIPSRFHAAFVKKGILLPAFTPFASN